MINILHQLSNEAKELAKDKNLSLFAQKFLKYLELLNNFTLWLGKKNKTSKDDVSAACNDYLKVSGICWSCTFLVKNIKG